MNWRRRQRRLRLIPHLANADGFWWVVLIAAVLTIGFALTWGFWGELHGNQESLSATVRNLGLVIGGGVAIVLAVWRSLVATRQASTAHRGLLNERYRQSAEMLGGNVLSVRLGGIYALQHLAEEHPEQYHVQVVSLLCAFVRHPPGHNGNAKANDAEVTASLESDHPRLREDIQTAIDAISTCHERHLSIESAQSYWLDLHGADLRGADLSYKNLSAAPKDMEKRFSSHFELMRNVMGRTNLRGAMLDGANLTFTDLSGVDLSHATGLTQFDLDIAIIRHSPQLNATRDAVTGELLRWDADCSAAKDD